MTSSTGRPLPVDYVAGRFFVCPVTADGESLRLFTDTGGGLFITREAVRRLRLPVAEVTVGSDTFAVTDLPAFTESASIPPVVTEADPRHEQFRGRIFVQDADERLAVDDGMLGQVWFGGRTWTFDYPAGRLLVHDAGEDPASGAGTVRLGFR